MGGGIRDVKKERDKQLFQSLLPLEQVALA